MDSKWLSRALLLLAIDRDFGTVHIEHNAPRRIDSFGPVDHIPIERGQTDQVFFLRQHLGLEQLRERGQGRDTLPNLTRADEPESRILKEARGVVNISIISQFAPDRGSLQIGLRRLDILAPPGIAHVTVHEFAQAETFIQLAHQN